MGPFGPKLAHLVPPLWSIVIQVKKVIRNVEISCFSKKGQKRSRKPLFAIFSVIFFRGRLLRFHHLLLQFLTDLDNSGCILFTIGWTSFCAIRILNFCLRPKWHHLKVCQPKKVFFITNIKMKWPPFCFEIKIQNSDHTKASPSDYEENATRIIQIG